MDYIIVFLLVLLSGIFSGLNIGLLSLDVTELERKIKLGNKDAKRILKVRKNGNFLLTVILLGNVAVNSTMAIFLSGIATGVIAGVVSTGLIVVFGEIIPQAIFSRYALKYGSKLVWVIEFFSIVLFVICKPIAMILDKVLGKELPTIWDKSELKEIIKDHEDMSGSEIDKDEERIVIGALTYSDKLVEDIMTPSTVVFTLESDVIITDDVIKTIKEKGFSRIPIMKNNEIINILNVKSLLGIGLSEKKCIFDVQDLLKPTVVLDSTKLDIVYNKMITDRTQVILVYDEFGTFRGIVSLEDVIEEILNVEIVDETDKVEDMREHAKENNEIFN